MSAWNDRLIDAMPDPAEIASRQRAAAVAGVSGRLQQIIARYADLEAASHAAAAGSAGVKVAASRTPPIPVNLDLVDLTGPANTGSVLVAAGSPWPTDQIGHIAVQSELDFWACDWASRRDEQPPAPNVRDLSAWLDVRLEWAYDHHGAWDEMAVCMERVARALYGTLTPRTGRTVPVSAPCPRGDCGGALSRRDDGWIECGCGNLLSEAEYAEWSNMVIARIAHNGWGTSAKEISFTTGRPIGTIHRWAHEFAWTRTGKEHRPVLYAKTEVTATLAKVAEREAREAATRDVTLEGQTCADLR